MLGYSEKDLDEMINSIHDAKLYYASNAEIIALEVDPIFLGLLKAKDFLQGLWAEGYFDHA